MLPPVTIVLFGATGDLAKRKLLPALGELERQGLLHDDTRIVAVGRKELTDESIRSLLGVTLQKLAARIDYHQLEFSDSAAYARLAQRLRERTCVFYLATAPESFPVIIQQLDRHSLARGNRVVFEKPFGSDLRSAQALNKQITKVFDEQSIYRIDHYLGKEFVQNILVLRSTNPVFETVWRSALIDNVQIVVSEKLGVGSRGGYYDHAGALRDMVQNHLLQLLALTAMELPKTVHADTIRDAKVRVLRAVRTSAKLADDLVLGQYQAGIIDGKGIPAYNQEPGVAAGSQTETFVAVRLSVATPRWRGVPFYLKTGKALDCGCAQIVITFKEAPCSLICGPKGMLSANKLVLRIQPNEGLKMHFNLKDPGTPYATAHMMDFSHEAEFGTNTPEAYERLLADVLRGDQTLFTRWDEVQAQWKIVDKLRAAGVSLQSYAAGSHGPVEAQAMLAREDRTWHRECE
jgi:glucose-6-phosphate 1-dehydrogenase